MAVTINYEQIRITELDSYLFGQGTHYEIYNKMGAHIAKKDGKPGVYFAVWAPAAKDVYVIGEFNNWNAFGYDMKKISDGGIYELFIEGAKAGQMYKYLIISQSGEAIYKADPYANAAQLRPETASIITDLNGFKWTDSVWVERKKKENHLKSAMSIYECHLGSWKKKDDGTEDGFYTYRELAPELAKYVSDMGYTHIELMGIAEHPFDGSWGYQVTGYYAPTSRYGSPADFMYFVDYLHSKGIGVILDWVPAHFPKDEHGLGRFDGTALYEHEDPKRGEHPHWGTYIYNYGRNEVRNFLVANALYWAEKYHIDGIRIDAVASMLYLDYGRGDGEWLPNIYGGNENLEAIDFIKELNSKMHELHKGVIMIAEESTAWPMMTHPVEAGGLGFDYKWNMGWMNDFLNYMKLDPLYRKYHHNDLTFSMVYAYSEKFILVLSHDEVVHEKGSMIAKMPGGYEDKFSNLRVAYGYMMTHPGKKLLFMGQEFGQLREWSEARSLDWFLLDQPLHKKMQKWVADLNHMYTTYDACYYNDNNQMGFEWTKVDDANTSIIAFVRRGKTVKDQLLFVCNFVPVERKDYWIGVPCLTEYEEIINSDAKIYGGSGTKNGKVKAFEEKCDRMPYAISIDIAPLSMMVFKYDYVDKKPAIAKKPAAAKTSTEKKTTK